MNKEKPDKNSALSAPPPPVPLSTVACGYLETWWEYYIRRGPDIFGCRLIVSTPWGGNATSLPALATWGTFVPLPPLPPPPC